MNTVRPDAHKTIRWIAVAVAATFAFHTAVTAFSPALNQALDPPRQIQVCQEELANVQTICQEEMAKAQESCSVKLERIHTAVVGEMPEPGFWGPAHQH